MPELASRPAVTLGMMRWDVWSGDLTPNSSYLQALKIISDPKWEKLGYWPWFAKKDAHGNLLSIIESDPAVIEQENELAHNAGIDYWAFLKYTDPDQNYEGGLGETFQRYLQSSNKHKIKFCFILDNRSTTPAYFDRNLSYLRDPQYLTVLADRPLVCLYPHGIPNLADFITHLRTSIVRLGLADPYIVSYDIFGHGEDATSHYAPGCGWGAHGSTYASFIEENQRRWNAAAGVHVPNAAQHWDCRPYFETPPSWWKTPDSCWYQSPTGEEYTRMLQAAVDFVRAHPEKCPAQTIFSKEFNGPTEGGAAWPSTAKSTTYLDAINRLRKSPQDQLA